MGSKRRASSSGSPVFLPPIDTAVAIGSVLLQPVVASPVHSDEAPLTNIMQATIALHNVGGSCLHRSVDLNVIPVLDGEPLGNRLIGDVLGRIGARRLLP